MHKIFEAAKKKYGLHMKKLLLVAGALAFLLVFVSLYDAIDSGRWEGVVLRCGIIAGLYGILFAWSIYSIKAQKYCGFLRKYVDNLTPMQAQQFIKDFEQGTKYKSIILGEEYIFFFAGSIRLHGCSYKDIRQAGWYGMSYIRGWERPTPVYYIYIFGEKKYKTFEMEGMEECANLYSAKILSKNPNVKIQRLDEYKEQLPF